MTFVNPQFGMIPELQNSMAIRGVAYGHRCLAIGDAEKVTHEDLEFALRNRCHVSASALPIKVFISRTDHAEIGKLASCHRVVIEDLLSLWEDHACVCAHLWPRDLRSAATPRKWRPCVETGVPMGVPVSGKRADVSGRVDRASRQSTL